MTDMKHQIREKRGLLSEQFKIIDDYVIIKYQNQPQVINLSDFLNGSSTIEDIIERFNRELAHFDTLKSAGFKLNGKVENNNVVLIKNDKLTQSNLRILEKLENVEKPVTNLQKFSDQKKMGISLTDMLSVLSDSDSE